MKNNDLFTLLPQKLVNDVIIDSFLLKCSYSVYLISNYVKVLSYSTHYVEWLKCECTSPSMFWSWIYQQKPMNHNIWIILLNVNNSHWVVAIVVLKLKLIVCLDSLHRINRNLLRTILNYVKSQHVSYSTSMFEEKDWDISAPTDLNLQKNSYDCGVHVCMYSFMVCNDCFFDCNNLDSKSARNWIATNIIPEPEEKLKHEKLDSKQRSLSFSTTKCSENFVENRKSPRGFISFKNFIKAVSSSLFLGRYSLCAL